jgi:N-acetyl-anhydromuramyl-L-alanine amidase AmpD
VRAAIVFGVLSVVGACGAPRPIAREPAPESEAARASETIVVRGELLPIGTRVVKWFDPDGYSAYSTALRFPGEVPADPAWEPPTGLRYRPGREGGRVDQLVLHYDACGTSRKCFKVLHDRRGLSVHFLLDLDGTLYQTLDLVDTAWHARQANPRSIGVEIANLGAYPPGEYPDAAAGPLVRGAIHGRTLEMRPYTDAQYAALAKLTRALCAHFPDLRPDAPRDAKGQVRTDVLSDAEFARFHGVLGHSHVTTAKTDPGPAMDWERVLSGARGID